MSGIADTTAGIMARCLKILANPSANEHDHRFVLDIMFDQGHAVGYSEALNKALAKFDAAVSKVGT